MLGTRQIVEKQTKMYLLMFFTHIIHHHHKFILFFPKKKKDFWSRRTKCNHNDRMVLLL